MARPYTVHELIPELQFWIKHPTDPSLRKLLRKTVATLKAFTDIVGEYESDGVAAPSEPRIFDETFGHTPSIAERIKDSE